MFVADTPEGSWVLHPPSGRSSEICEPLALFSLSPWCPQWNLITALPLQPTKQAIGLINEKNSSNDETSGWECYFFIAQGPGRAAENHHETCSTMNMGDRISIPPLVPFRVMFWPLSSVNTAIQHVPSLKACRLPIAGNYHPGTLLLTQFSPEQQDWGNEGEKVHRYFLQLGLQGMLEEMLRDDRVLTWYFQVCVEKHRRKTAPLQEDSLAPAYHIHLENKLTVAGKWLIHTKGVTRCPCSYVLTSSNATQAFEVLRSSCLFPCLLLPKLNCGDPFAILMKQLMPAWLSRGTTWRDSPAKQSPSKAMLPYTDIHSLLCRNNQMFW